ncbi:MAG: Nif3-like dinuclear metal center hexameric protein [Armatimonadota bacterium]|nr:Nif3-like dinuclear metal center hexameric protein [Armatimonadota bacterium]
MKAIDLETHLRKIGTWVNYKNTTDYFHAGDPNTDVTGIAVAWQGRLPALKKAVGLGCNLLVTHEQIDYPEPQIARKGEIQPYAAEKRKFIEDSKLVIYRCHDMWDRMPKIGIVPAWADFLGLDEPLVFEEVEAVVYKSPKPSLPELARYVLAKVRPLGQDSVEMVGDPDARITRVAIGCGAGTVYPTAVRHGADAFVGSDDGMRYWADGSWALDRGFPLVLVNHCTTEEPGMMSLAKYLGEQFPGVKVTHIPQGCMYRTVG